MNSLVDKLVNDNRQEPIEQEIDARATLRAIRDDGFMAEGWCKRKGFHYAHLHMVVHGKRGRGKKSSPVADKILEALRADGYLRFREMSNG